jgi:hypothetical protein
MRINNIQIKEKISLLYKNEETFFNMVDQLPTDGPEWLCNVIKIAGNTFDNEEELLTEDVELWWQNLLDCVHELIGNPAFKDVMEYAL